MVSLGFSHWTSLCISNLNLPFSDNKENIYGYKTNKGEVALEFEMTES